jgi:hypothetical protein
VAELLDGREAVIPISRVRELLESAQVRPRDTYTIQINGAAIGRYVGAVVRKGHEVAIAESEAQRLRRALSEVARG